MIGAVILSIGLVIVLVGYARLHSLAGEQVAASYDRGREKGDEVGYRRGYEEGHAVGYERGRTEGWGSGYETGREEGWDDALESEED